MAGGTPVWENDGTIVLNSGDSISFSMQFDGGAVMPSRTDVSVERAPQWWKAWFTADKVLRESPRPPAQRCDGYCYQCEQPCRGEVRGL